MQDRYAGDVGDYLKFGLLRDLAAPWSGQPGYRIGVCWYRVPDETHNADGKHMSYLEPGAKGHRHLRQCDPALLALLATVVQNGRTVHALEDAGVLPENTLFYAEPLSRGMTDAARRTWHDGALKALGQAQVVFVDPDNGLRPAGWRQHREKFALADEVAAYVARGQSVVVYQHADRTSGGYPVQVRARLQALSEATGLPALGAVVARRGSMRFFLILAVQDHRERIRDLVVRHAERWSPHMEYLDFASLAAEPVVLRASGAWAGPSQQVTPMLGAGAARPDQRSRRRGCLLGGAIGDALGAPIEFHSLAAIRSRFGPDGLTDLVPAYGRVGAITDDTQMTMFTAEGLIRAWVRGTIRGIGYPPAVVWGAYQRWLAAQEGTMGVLDSDEAGWLARHPSLHSPRAPGMTCLTALRGGVPGTTTGQLNTSKGCGGVMRVAPAGLIGDESFELGCQLAALTHGHPSGFLSAGAFALMVATLYRGALLPEAVDEAMQRLRREPDHDEVLYALERAVRAAAGEPAVPETVESLGAGWVAEEALAIAVFAALRAQDFDNGVLLAVNHSGDSDSTGSLAGNLLGTMLGEDALPLQWLQRLELADVIGELADDLGGVLDLSDRTRWASFDAPIPEFWQKYPGC